MKTITAFAILVVPLLLAVKGSSTRPTPMLICRAVLEENCEGWFTHDMRIDMKTVVLPEIRYIFRKQVKYSYLPRGPHLFVQHREGWAAPLNLEHQT
jgi:hypothetical protein